MRPCCSETQDLERTPSPACRVLLCLNLRLFNTQKALRRQSRSALSLQSQRGVHFFMEESSGEEHWRECSVVDVLRVNYAAQVGKSSG